MFCMRLSLTTTKIVARAFSEWMKKKQINTFTLLIERFVKPSVSVIRFKNTGTRIPITAEQFNQICLEITARCSESLVELNLDVFHVLAAQDLSNYGPGIGGGISYDYHKGAPMCPYRDISSGIEMVMACPKIRKLAVYAPHCKYEFALLSRVHWDFLSIHWWDAAYEMRIRELDINYPNRHKEPFNPERHNVDRTPLRLRVKHFKIYHVHELEFIEFDDIHVLNLSESSNRSLFSYGMAQILINVMRRHKVKVLISGDIVQRIRSPGNISRLNSMRSIIKYV